MVTRRLRAAVLAALLPLALVASCGPSGDVPFLRTQHDVLADAGDAGAADVAIPAEPREDWDETGAGPLTGIFAVQAVIAAKVVVPIESRELFRLRIVQRGDKIRQRVTLCALTLPSVEGVAELSIPPALDALIRSKSVESEGAFLSSAGVLGATYAPLPPLLVVGATLADPVKDPLPKKDAQQTALDEDMDGFPGVSLGAKTVTCKGPELLYVALRTRAVIEATVKSFDRMEGTADVTLDQSVLGYSNDCMAASASLKVELLPKSVLRAVRVGAAEDLDGNGNVSCPEISLAAPTLFADLAKDGGAQLRARAASPHWHDQSGSAGLPPAHWHVRPVV